MMHLENWWWLSHITICDYCGKKVSQTQKYLGYDTCKKCVEICENDRGNLTTIHTQKLQFQHLKNIKTYEIILSSVKAAVEEAFEVDE